MLETSYPANICANHPKDVEPQLLSVLASAANKFPELLPAAGKNTANANQFTPVAVPEDFKPEDFLNYQLLLARLLLARHSTGYSTAQCNPGLALMEKICQSAPRTSASTGEIRALANIHHRLARELMGLGRCDEASERASSAFDLYRRADLTFKPEGIITALTMHTISGTEYPYEQSIPFHLGSLKQLRGALRDPTLSPRDRDEYECELAIAEGDFHLRVFFYVKRAHVDQRSVAFNLEQSIVEFERIEEMAYGEISQRFELSQFRGLFSYLRLMCRSLTSALSSYEKALEMIKRMRGQYHPSLFEPLQNIVAILELLNVVDKTGSLEQRTSELGLIREAFSAL